ncbi:MLO-like protein 13 [Carica papaya]|uniref:MLO-like protein 13 n=1 Tax=Carica papaya TaxID=3649 RepID=UPI000B8D0A2D|nr:MLO-like protein 13 [Carica papaya]
MAEEGSSSLEYTATWVVAVVCFVIVLLSLLAERGLHYLGKCLKRSKQDALFEALQKLKEELMLLGFISLLLTVFQGAIRNICMPTDLANKMLPCKKHNKNEHNKDYSYLSANSRHLLAASSSPDQCVLEGKAPLLSLEALHQLHIFIFVLAVVHVIFCATTMVLGGARVRQWKKWEDSIKRASSINSAKDTPAHHHHEFFRHRAGGYWKKTAVVSWMIAFFRHFYGSVKKSDYIALRRGFIMAHCPANPNFDFHKYMMRTLEVDFKKVVGISWYLWLFVVVFLLLNMKGWNTYFWLSFVPLVLLLLVGTKLQHIITRLALEVKESNEQREGAPRVKPSDELFWFHRPVLVLHLIHFILFQNAFELAFLFWIWSTYGIHSCIMEQLAMMIPRLLIGVIVQVLCSYSTMPLYALVGQMGSRFKEGIFNKFVQSSLEVWIGNRGNRGEASRSITQLQRVENRVEEAAMVDIIEESVTHLPSVASNSLP